MGFLKKSSAPSELPDLAISDADGSQGIVPPQSDLPPLPAQQEVPVQTQEAPAVVPQRAPPTVVPASAVPQQQREVPGEDYVEVSHAEAVQNAQNSKPKQAERGPVDTSNIREVLNTALPETHNSSRHGFFDQVLDDINEELKDVGQLQNWYEKKFSQENIVSNMKGYWEGNKADVIIESFGAEYKMQINEKIKALQDLEEDWREIYFRLVKKEEEMKKEERELKEILAEFVNLCKRKTDYEEKTGTQKKK
jgi:hypothetical protein